MARTVAKSYRNNRSVKLFVYGTLKQGCENHDAYCNGALSVEPARVRGKLYKHPTGLPILLVPVNDILAVGTTDPLADVATQVSHQVYLNDSNSQLGHEMHETNWRLIRGELMIFDDPEPRLAAIDELEDFYPSQPSLYRRVLVPVLNHENLIVSAWVYVLGLDIEGLKPIDANAWRC